MYIHDRTRNAARIEYSKMPALSEVQVMTHLPFIPKLHEGYLRRWTASVIRITLLRFFPWRRER